MNKNIHYEIRIIDKDIYPYDFSLEEYFAQDDFSDCYDTYNKAVNFIEMLNKNGYNAYLFEY